MNDFDTFGPRCSKSGIPRQVRTLTSSHQFSAVWLRLLCKKTRHEGNFCLSQSHHCAARRHCSRPPARTLSLHVRGSTHSLDAYDPAADRLRGPGRKLLSNTYQLSRKQDEDVHEWFWPAVTWSWRVANLEQTADQLAASTRISDLLLVQLGNFCSGSCRPGSPLLTTELN